ncbi:MAG: hypothetical protein US30_C0004G0123 [Candidatus Moranbacteria bacterium GW2011_GWF2_36_839]|nr:MAG: hypothetical protein US27_C0002G0126 [Candidatus Moranbacteria bacterium GW2011_GWF1_36_78]KKQ17379.1 MAG: hypothetical protein US30_C0004G0123 [Candidatus Moranbacteria bacterium GW2011_GWF2_36_839]HAT73779.1 hypothetical protein [Candidatus Moranbacteria bacterium]HBY11078.1 hypothetical protein [Candidatus Moranbacteria bacterium]
MDNQELDEKTTEEESTQNKMKEWLEDNMRIIVSILIVILIAGGIYSYSKRTESPQVDEPTVAVDEENNSTTKQETVNDSTVSQEKETSSVATSQETENSLIETAAKGDSQTKLARRALADFLEKNPDSALTAEHKIYIEDYLRKNSGHKGRVSVGTSIEFSKDLIKDAISKSKNLNENQLKNLHKYAVRVPSLS